MLCRKKAQGTLLSVIMWIVIAFVIVMFFGLWTYGNAKITDALKKTNLVTKDYNLTLITEQTFGQLDKAYGELKWLAFLLIFGQAFTIIMVNLTKKAHPMLFIAFFFINILGVIVAVAVSNQYTTLSNDANFGSTLQGFTGMNFVLEKLPYFAVALGFIFLISLFIGYSRYNEYEVNVI